MVVGVIATVVWSGADSDVTGANPTTGAVPPSTADPAEENRLLSESVGFGVLRELDGTALPTPDAACFARAMDAVDPAVREAAAELMTDPLAWDRLAPEVQFPLVSAYVGCSDIDFIRNVLAIGIINSIDLAPCVSESWRDVLTAEAIVASISFGGGFDDLSPEIVADMTAGAAACLPDPEWWIEDIALDIDQAFGLSLDEARCVARSYVSTLGIEVAIRRRVLTIPTLAVSPDQFDALQLSARCGTDISLPPIGIDAMPGHCIAFFGSPDRLPAIVSCDAAHNAEVVSVVDLGTVFADWPGVRILALYTQVTCIRDAETALDGREGFAVNWTYPSRRTWEQAGRRLMCVVGRAGGVDWTGPIGIVPTAPTTTPQPITTPPPTTPLPTTPPATTSPTTTATPTPTLLVDINSLTVGQCLLGAELVDGDIGDGLMEVVDCSTPHHAEVFHVSAFDEPAGAPYPGDEQARNTTLARCHPAFDAYVGRIWAESRLGFTYVYPYDFEWEGNNRLVLCYLWDRLGRPLIGSMAGTGQ